MKAAVYDKYGPPSVVAIADVEVPTPGDHEVLVQVVTTSVSTVDAIFRSGKHGFARMATGMFRPRDSILGSDFAGTVTAVGSRVTQFKAGDNVFGPSGPQMGSHAEHVVVPQDCGIIVKPDSLTFSEAAATPYGYLTALPFLRDHGKVSAGQRVLVIGASGAIGVFAIQLAKIMGAHVTGVCSSSNVELVTSLGADAVVDYTKTDITNLTERYDVIFDTIGAYTIGQLRGQLTPIGAYLNPVISFPILWQTLRTRSTSGQRVRFAATGLRKGNEKAADLTDGLKLLQSGQLRPVVGNVFSFDDIVRAHELVDSGHKVGAVMVDMLGPQDTDR